jgi:hypothetical protein
MKKERIEEERLERKCLQGLFSVKPNLRTFGFYSATCNCIAELREAEKL